MSEAAHTIEGWYTLHDFRTMDWQAWKAASDEERAEVLHTLEGFLHGWQDIEDQGKGSYGLYSIVGHKADLLFLHMRPTLKELNEIENEVNKSRLAQYLYPTRSYVSIVELGGYTGDPEKDPTVKSRLYPILSKDKHICFYPMNKKRQGNENWFMLPTEERIRMMKNHGAIGRKYAGKVQQIVTGSVGLDDWEWGVTLFAEDPLQFKKIVYEMRFDEVSARFGEFGDFLVGYGIPKEDLNRYFRI
ncbi:conserved hypothetical protein [[Clostridium] ultunense Esp]|uniref:hydrogen peroxide-dependent heme synthase n=1 Tax=Thermicanus aegyptius TaxID=94009 RepID=UPI0002B70EC9|nr:hydrogen peroxide-dependent heme synthase [Thermicanus aegyptius]CCQ93344.1 conserved hypothetical protein [[Clostridium] ultunense Esp]